METRADEILGPVSGTEYDLLLSKLDGTRGNRVFSYFGIEAAQRTAEALLAAQKVVSKTGGLAGTTAMLEKRKRKRKKGGAGPCGAKHPKLLDILTSSPLHSVGTPWTMGAKGAPSSPLSAVGPAMKSSTLLEYSAMKPESDDELAREVLRPCDPRTPRS